MVILKIKITNQFKRDLKLLKKRKYNLAFMEYVVDTLTSGKNYQKSIKTIHSLGGINGYYECHIQPDWLLIYKIEKEQLVLVLSRTGTHCDLFDM